MLCPILDLAKSLIAIPSISPHDLGCQDIIAKRLKKSGFFINRINIKDTCNLYATYGNNTNKKNIMFLGHTDVVPSGSLKKWKFHPFHPTVHNGYLFGRGAVDMKGALAAMIIAIEQFVFKYSKSSYKLTVLLTSDEESEGINGIRKIAQHLLRKQEPIDYCIVVEPTSVNKLGDTIKNGRRGSLTVNLTVHGIQGHIAYVKSTDNPIHNIIPFISSLVNKQWDYNNKSLPDTSLQLFQIQSGLNVDNMISDHICTKFNFRFGINTSVDFIKSEIINLLNINKLKYDITWKLSAKPFYTKPGFLTTIVSDVIRDLSNIRTQLSTAGGTSDGRFLVTTGAQIIELGLINKTIHQVNEHVNVNDLQKLSAMYFEIIKRLVFENPY